jgi:hypothetical protein
MSTISGPLSAVPSPWLPSEDENEKAAFAGGFSVPAALCG